MQAAPGTSSKIALPILALCALGCILLFICIAIVLALIPVYLPRKNLTPVVDDDLSTSPFYLEYSAPADSGTAISGTVQNKDQVKQALGVSDPDVNVGDIQTTPGSVDRRKRSFFGSRPKRQIYIRILVTLNFISLNCNTRCGLKRKALREKLRTTLTILNCPLEINGGISGIKIITVTLTLIGILTQKPIGFGGPLTSLTFSSTSSGDFTNPSIWNQQQLPNGDCNIVIAAGTIVTLSRPGLGINATSIIVYGTLILGGGNAQFTFANPLVIKVRKGGKIQDATTNKLILIPVNSVILLYSGGGFSEPGTTIQIYTASGVGAKFTLTVATGPFTCAALSPGELRHENKIVFFVVQSGLFGAGSTYCGGSAPTVDDCTDSPCGLEILPGFVLSTADLNGVCNINFDQITVDAGATLQLGTPGSPNGFKFLFPLNLISAGIISFVASGGGILLPIGSVFEILASGQFISVRPTFLQIFDLITGALGLTLDLGLGFVGPFARRAISLTEFAVIIIGPGTVTTSIPVTVTTSISVTVIPA